MKFAYADPPYLGCGSRYLKHHPEAMIWDDPDEHRRLILRLSDEYPDGWALSMNVPALRTLLPMCPEDVRICSWVKPFAIFKPNVTRAWTWEPIIFRGGRDIPRTDPTWRDHIETAAISECITLRKGLVGAKPKAVCEWILNGLGYQPGDTLDDLFPGTNIMAMAVAARNGSEPMDLGLFADMAMIRGG